VTCCIWELHESARHLVTLLERGISSTQGLYLDRTGQHNTEIRGNERIPTDDPSIRATKTAPQTVRPMSSAQRGAMVLIFLSYNTTWFKFHTLICGNNALKQKTVHSSTSSMYVYLYTTRLRINASQLSLLSKSVYWLENLYDALLHFSIKFSFKYDFRFSRHYGQQFSS
jgi:hypothetical protein